MSRSSFQESIRDKAMLPLHFEAPEVMLKIHKAAIDEPECNCNGALYSFATGKASSLTTR